MKMINNDKSKRKAKEIEEKQLDSTSEDQRLSLADELADEATKCLNRGDALSAIPLLIQASEFYEISAEKKRNRAQSAFKALKDRRIDDFIMHLGYAGIDAMEYLQKQGQKGRTYLEGYKELVSGKFFELFNQIIDGHEEKEAELNLWDRRHKIAEQLRKHFYTYKGGPE